MATKSAMATRGAAQGPHEKADAQDGELEVYSSRGGWLAAHIVADNAQSGRLTVEFHVPELGVCRKWLRPNSDRLRFVSSSTGVPSGVGGTSGKNSTATATYGTAVSTFGGGCETLAATCGAGRGAERELSSAEKEDEGEEQDAENLVAPPDRRSSVAVPGKMRPEQLGDKTPLLGTSLAPLPFGTLLFNGTFRLGKKIGAGSFGTVHAAVNCQSGREVAVKLEPIGAKCPQLMDETRRYQAMGKTPAANAADLVPQVFVFGSIGDYNVMVMELLGPSLDKLLLRCGGTFQLDTIVNLAGQLLDCVEFVHSKGLIHRDIKPNNFTVGYSTENRSKVYMIDFGLAKRYLQGDQHVPKRSGLPFVGTVRFASCNALMGVEQSRRDDLMSLSYVLFYWLRGSLPWQNLNAPTKPQRNKMVLEMKQQTASGELCGASPRNFACFFDYCESLRFEATPDYTYLRKILASVPMPRRSRTSVTHPVMEWELVEDSSCVSDA